MSLGRSSWWLLGHCGVCRCADWWKVRWYNPEVHHCFPWQVEASRGLIDVDHGGAWERLTVGRMTLQAQNGGASNLYWLLVRRHQVNRDWDKITGCESRSEEAGHGPEARLGSRICHSSDGSLCDCGAATSEDLIVRSIHRHCFTSGWFKKRALRHCPLVKMWWASLARTSAGGSTFLRWSRPRRRCLRRRRRGGECRLSHYEAFSDDTCANTAPISEVGDGLASTRGDAPLRLTRRPL